MLTRRELLHIALGTATSLACHALWPTLARAARSARLHVFLPTDMGTPALQKLLSDAIPNAEVIAFGRYRDFESGLEDKPDAALALEPTLSALSLPIAARGTSGGSSIEPYVLISVGKTIEPSALTSVGAVDILGHQRMKAFLANLLGATPRMERVTKVEDLLPLLQFASVDAVLLPDRLSASFRARSKLDLRATPLARGIGLPCVATLTPGGVAATEGVRRLDPRTNQVMGVTTWA